MSERKVLNKYYPPDFDPSKIPRSKEARNKTFTIRLMAPCNMRCTTCGEYIYKGRKFNAKKEDVDDMNHLGLRIYRFYIKCTACLSEICFRTDPANTDYVLEAGATRNFEALAKAEKQAEAEEKARQDELANNPMKLLEERTEASKNEMSRMEALEELQELNKREVKVDYETMLQRYDTLREMQAAKQIEEEEDEIKKIFGRHGGEKIKRLADGEDEEDDDSDEEKRRTKKVKTEKVTDFLVAGNKEKEKKFGLSKSSIGALVKKKIPATQKPSTSAVSNDKKTQEEPKKSAISSLGLLGAYSDSDESD